jgi:hypothetical protein
MLKNILKTFVKLILNRGVGSQFGEDKVLLTILPKKGRYVDVGAYHPHLYSNTYALYRGGGQASRLSLIRSLEYSGRSSDPGTSS